MMHILLFEKKRSLALDFIHLELHDQGQNFIIIVVGAIFCIQRRFCGGRSRVGAEDEKNIPVDCSYLDTHR